jgi:hypothetical protein|tara:strand:+ start:7 stop:294 length:288 start_codon:yes stop_codon:yes gene_type:complete
MSNQRKEYDNPKDAITDLTTLGAAAIINKGLQKPIVKDTIKKAEDKLESWVELAPGGTTILDTTKKLKEKGFYADVDPFKKKFEVGFKIGLGGKN